MFRRKDGEAEVGLWLQSEKLPTTPATLFSLRFGGALKAVGFGDTVRGLWEPYYPMDRSRGGRPGVPPETRTR